MPIIVFFGEHGEQTLRENKKFNALSFNWKEAEMCRNHILYRYKWECKRFDSFYEKNSDPKNGELPAARLNQFFKEIEVHI